MYVLNTGISQLQTELTNAGFYKGKIDGLEGPQTLDGYKQALAHAGVRFDGWANPRIRIGFAQLCFRQYKLYNGNIDGLMGPATDYAEEQYLRLFQGKATDNWRDTPVTQSELASQPAQSSTWPKQDEASMNAFFGTPGTNIVPLELPYPMLLAWDKSQTLHSIQVNAKVHNSVLRVLSQVPKIYSPAQISDIGLNIFGGCLNIRKMRGGSKMSIHSWACAIDFDPERNQLKWGRDRARLAQDDAKPFWNLWFAEGWVSLGNSRNYDWMHVQAARL